METFRKGLGYDNLLSLLAVELRESPVQLREALLSGSSAPADVIELLEEKGFFETGFCLASPIHDPADGATLLTENSVLKPSYIKALLSRQATDWDHPIGPLWFEPRPPILQHFGGKLRAHFEALVGQARSQRSEGSKRIHRALAHAPILHCVNECFDEVLQALLSEERALGAFLPAITRVESGPTVGKSVDCAFISMAVLALYSQQQPLARRKEYIKPVGTAALLQDLSLLVESSPPLADHAARSAQMAAHLGLGDGVEQAVRFHHQVRDPSGLPALSDATALSVHAKVLVAVNVFLELAAGAFGGSLFEIMKAMNRLAAGRYLDGEAVRALARLYLPKGKCFILEEASAIARRCPKAYAAPVLWPVTGDKVPTVFLCRVENCEHQTDQTSYIAKSVPFIVQGESIGTIHQGEYFTCPHLTGMLERMYAALGSRRDH
jgi:hypothetical protein